MDVAVLLSSPIIWILTVLFTLYVLYSYGTSTFDYFSNQGIPGPKPIPYIGNMWGLWKVNLPKFDREMVKKYGKVFGYFDGTLPNLWTTDADIIKSVFVKDFDHFINRRNFIVNAKFIRKIVTLMRDQQWKDVRSSLTPAFTSGKIKRMSTIIKESADRLVDKLKGIAETDDQLEAKEHLSAFTMEVIAKCAFGLTIDHLGEKNDPFMRKARQVFSPRVNRSPLILMPFLFPKLMSIMGERIFISEQFSFFIRVVEDLIKKRSASPQKYHDFIEVATESIMEYTHQVNGEIVPIFSREEVDEIVIAQSVVFLLAGFDTTATTLTSAIFLLARNPEVQRALHEGILRKLETFEEVNHDMILDFPYIDHVIHEVLRMCPPIPRIERACNEDVIYNGISIRKGTLVTVPLFALHYDEKYYPEPNLFKPERWNPDSHLKPNPYAFMSFGMGPRNCIGMRFAMEEIKIALCTLVKNFHFFAVAETPEEMEFEDGFLTATQPVHAIVGIETRS